jgi:hypothetical protein
VRDGAAFVMRAPHYVNISAEAIAVLAEGIAQGEMARIVWDDELHFVGDEGATAQYVLVLDALNFCFWPEPAWNYNRLAATLKKTILNEPERFQAKHLARVQAADTRAMLGYSDDIPLLAERTALLRELGAVLAAGWQGEAAHLIRAANHSAATLVALVTAQLPGFRDHAIYRGHPIYLYKRVQILVGDLWGSFGGQGLGRFDDIEQLTMFADYRIPQLLRGEGILHYDSTLATLVDSYQEVQSGSEMEIELRAATIHAVELLRHALTERGYAISSLELDWILWNVGEARKEKLAPHHRTLTIYY